MRLQIWQSQSCTTGDGVYDVAMQRQHGCLGGVWHSLHGRNRLLTSDCLWMQRYIGAESKPYIVIPGREHHLLAQEKATGTKAD